MERPIFIESVPCTCFKCGYKFTDGETCYEYDDMILCEDCMDKVLESLKEECETVAESAERWF